MSEEPQIPPPETLLRAFTALGKLVAAEYGERYTLAEIAGMHGVGGLFMENFTDEDVDAIRAVEDYLDVLPATGSAAAGEEPL